MTDYIKEAEETARRERGEPTVLSRDEQQLLEALRFDAEIGPEFYSRLVELIERLVELVNTLAAMIPGPDTKEKTWRRPEL